MYEESGSDPELSDAKATVKRYLEMTARSVQQVRPWERLAALCERTDDYCGWVDAQASLCELPGVGLQRMSNAAIQVLTGVRKQRYQMQGLEVKRKVKQAIRRIIAMMAKNSDECSPSDFSRLAWMSLNILPWKVLFRSRNRSFPPSASGSSARRTSTFGIVCASSYIAPPMRTITANIPAKSV